MPAHAEASPNLSSTSSSDLRARASEEHEDLQRTLEAIAIEYKHIVAEMLTATPVSSPIKHKLQLSATRLSLDGSVYSDSEFFDAPEDAILVLRDNDGEPEDILVVSDDEHDSDSDGEAAGDDDEEYRFNGYGGDDYEMQKVKQATSRASAGSGLGGVGSVRGVSTSTADLNALGVGSTEITPKASPTSPTAAGRDLWPLPVAARVARRATVPVNKTVPPSLIQSLRKNVGKDLSTIAMPVIANEPLSLLQRYAEMLEYSRMLDTAAQRTVETGEQLAYVTAFAIAGLSNMRCKERSIRKPFNPMLNETFELVREDLGFRYVAEKISHRPLMVATYADSEHWTYSYSPQPSQKFWGKSAEIVMDGPVNITVTHGGQEVRYWYTLPTTFLRNVIAGEKYVEPSGQFVVHSSSGHRAVVEFKSKSMFSATRSEDVVAKLFGVDGELGFWLQGKWTASLAIMPQNTPVWTAGDILPDPALHYGFSNFAATLNEITPIEDGQLPPTDSRLRPDQRELELVNIDDAEELKKKVEEIQREKRRKGTLPEGMHSLWFRKVDDKVWVPRDGPHNYWECRRRRDWAECPALW
ncbi:Oxysterol-binding protein-domain-containing protein [Dipodascopsis tothii]|uniref:Oxysterol-binding protein-domain-containing protein n=1 Tax=Dipodascopsis tothii TaxID=44089 RepID=UPI0034CD6AFF